MLRASWSTRFIHISLFRNRKVDRYFQPSIPIISLWYNTSIDAWIITSIVNSIEIMLYKTRKYESMKKKKKERNVAIISPVHLYKTRISHKRRDGGRTPVRNRRNTRYIYIYIKSPLNPLCFGNTCRKSQPPNANIILIAIEKYRHYEETLFSFSPSFLPLSLSFNFAAAQQRPRRRD